MCWFFPSPFQGEGRGEGQPTPGKKVVKLLMASQIMNVTLRGFHE